MARKRRDRRREPSRSLGKRKPGPTRRKLDPRLAYLLDLSREELEVLKHIEDEQVLRWEREAHEVMSSFGDSEHEDKTRELEDRIEKLRIKLFSPVTAGVYLPRGFRPFPLREPYYSVFILSDASARDLARLGARIRNQTCDLFTAFVPTSAMPRLEASSAVRAVELARPLLPSLDIARPYAGIDALQMGPPAMTGANVIIGIIDTQIDIYHPDFRTAAGMSRVRFIWDQLLYPVGAEAGPPVAPALPGFAPAGGTYGVEYSQANINAELTAPPPAYGIVRHGGWIAEHGTHVAGIAAGNGAGQAMPSYRGAAPGADIIFVAPFGDAGIARFADSAGVADACSYIFARSTQLGRPCVINISLGDYQGPHDGTLLGEQFLDNLLGIPGRAIVIGAGNASGLSCHARGIVATGGTTNLVLTYGAPPAGSSHLSDVIELWYDGHDRFTVTVTAPSGTTIGPVVPGSTSSSVPVGGGVTAHVTSLLKDARNGDNMISLIINVPAGGTITGNWKIALTGTTVINGFFHAWVDRNNEPLSAWQAPAVDNTQMTLTQPASCQRAITVGNHMKAGPPPTIHPASGVGPTRDGRVKPELATVGTNINAPRSRDMNSGAPGGLYTSMTGTSIAAPLVAGTCALLFQCRGAATTWANIKQILIDLAGTTLAGGPQSVPNNYFGFGWLQAGSACTTPAGNVDVWLRDDVTDTGLEPFTGAIAWLSPDIEVLDIAGNPVPNPSYQPLNRYNNVIRVTVRNRGTRAALNTEVYLYWADPATNIPFPSAWNATGIYSGAPGFTTQSNRLIIPQLDPGDSVAVQFAWAPPAPGANIRGDDHFCLLARLENASDPSPIGAGGWTSITQRNNIALRNVHVQPNHTGGDAILRFYVVGSGREDTLIVMPELVKGDVRLNIPVQALPWRDLRLLEKLGARRLDYGCGDWRKDPAAELTIDLKGDDVWRLTNIVGARTLQLEGGIASVLVAAAAGPLLVPCLHITEGARVPVTIGVERLDTDREQRFVHVAQYGAGELLGGVTLELRKGIER